MTITIFKNTNFGNNELVVNIPHPNYNFNSHELITFNDVIVRFPLLMGSIILEGEFNFSTKYFDYMRCIDGSDTTYYFIGAITAEKNILIFDITLDVVTTYNILNLPVTGTIVRMHNVDVNEEPFDNFIALNHEGNYTKSQYDFINYSGEQVRLIETAVNLVRLAPAKIITTDDESGTIILPQMTKPDHSTRYQVRTWGNTYFNDDSRAYTLYLYDNINQEVFDTVRALSGDGAISDSYSMPSDAMDISLQGNAEIINIIGVRKDIITNIDFITDFSYWYTSLPNYVPKNEALKGMFSIQFMSMQEKTTNIFPSWDLYHPTIGRTSDNKFIVEIWNDPKPSGAPYSCPKFVFSIFPLRGDENIRLATQEMKSVKGGQWLRAPLIFTMGQGEIFAAQESKLMRERSDFEKRVNNRQLDLREAERQIRIAQHDLQFGTSQLTGLAEITGGAISGNIGGIIGGAGGLISGQVNQHFVERIRALKNISYQQDRDLLAIAHRNNLRNIDLQEAIRRTVTNEIVFQPDESLGSYERHNGFIISKIQPDLQWLMSKDIEFCKYGYPTYLSVENFRMLENLRQNHTVYQWVNPIIEIGGKIGDFARNVLSSGIRILSRPYSSINIIDNPKIMNQNIDIQLNTKIDYSKMVINYEEI